MNKCTKCYAEFITPKVVLVPHYEVDTRIFEEIQTCPECGSEYFEEVTICNGCHQRYITSEEDYCKSCYADVSDAIGGLAKQKDISFGEAVDLFTAWSERY